jgi:hypothetical protein
MRPFVLRVSILAKALAALCALAIASAPVALAQHGGGGGHAGGGAAHFGGGPHVSAPPAPAISHPRPVTPAPRTSVVAPLVAPRPILRAPLYHYPFPVRPIPPGRLLFGVRARPIFFGYPFLGFGFGSLWLPNCDPFWGWGGDSFNCYGSPYSGLYYGNGFGNYGLGYGSSDLGVGDLDNQQAYPQSYYAQTFEPPPVMYSEERRESPELYLKDGTIYDVSDYWLTDNMLHFTTLEEGGQKSVEGVIAFDELDLQRTIDVNTQRGFHFVLRNEPLEQYLQDHPDAGSSSDTPSPSPAGPLPVLSQP